MQLTWKPPFILYLQTVAEVSCFLVPVSAIPITADYVELTLNMNIILQIGMLKVNAAAWQLLSVFCFFRHDVFSKI
jgi:hypothetical protein